MMKSIKTNWLIAVAMLGLSASAAPAPSPWEEPAQTLAAQIAEILGPGQARLTIHNLSSISNDEIPAIRRLLVGNLKALGITASGAESANEIRVTLSENQRERLWVVEVFEGNETQVAMAEVKLSAARAAQASSGVTLRSKAVLVTRDEVLAALETADALVAVEPEEIVIYSQSADGWQEQKRAAIGQKKPLPRDPRGMILPASGAEGFEAAVAGMSCSGSFQPAQPAGAWTIHCRESDDPWPILQSQTAGGSNSVKAFYNTARDYFTGVVTPNVDLDFPPFYTAIVIPRPDGSGLLFNGIDGKVQLLDTVPLKPIAGARDWGSDFATLHSGCGAGTQIIASGSGEAVSDSLRAYELPAQEAVPASAPLAMDGTVTALWSAPDGKSIFAVVRKTANAGATDEYEVDRVTGSCY
jgi:hypothetical protein